MTFCIKCAVNADKKHDAMCLKNMEFNLFINDIPILTVSCRLEMLIFKMALTNKHCVRFAFLSMITQIQCDPHARTQKTPSVCVCGGGGMGGGHENFF